MIAEPGSKFVVSPVLMMPCIAHRFFLLDSNATGRQGGSGDTFNWSTIPASLGSPWLLAGGLNPANIATAITRPKPWGVDVSSEVESSAGIKDKALINQFFHEVNRVDANA